MRLTTTKRSAPAISVPRLKALFTNSKKREENQAMAKTR